jgi:hypothetical protein
MNTYIILTTAIAFSSIGHSFAQPADVTSTPSGKTRVNVNAESKLAQDDGSAASCAFPDATFRGRSSQSAQSEHIIVGQKSRAEVNCELEQSQRNGTNMPTSIAGFHTPSGDAPTVAPTQTAIEKVLKDVE